MKIEELKREMDELLFLELEKRDKDENTALHLACAHNHKKAAQTLVEAGAFVDAKGECGFTPLHSYARYTRT